MVNSSMISQERLKSIIEYDLLLGVFTWKVRDDLALGYNERWNNRYAGKTAGTKKTDSTGYTYWYITINNRHYLAHRLAWLLVKGYLPDYVDHKDRNTLNNRWHNLREATQSQNQANRRPDRGYEVSRGGKYIVRIQLYNQRLNFGVFNSPDTAVAAYREAHKKVFGDYSVYNRLNRRV